MRPMPFICLSSSVGLISCMPFGAIPMQNHHRRGLFWGSICPSISLGFVKIHKNKKNIFLHFFSLKKVLKIKIFFRKTI